MEEPARITIETEKALTLSIIFLKEKKTYKFDQGRHEIVVSL